MKIGNMRIRIGRTPILFIIVIALLAGTWQLFKYQVRSGQIAQMTASAQHAVEVQGYTDVSINGIPAIGCRPDDPTKYTFSATNAQGAPVSGNVCGSLLGGWRLEFH